MLVSRSATTGWNPIGHVQLRNISCIWLWEKCAVPHGPTAFNRSSSLSRGENTLYEIHVHLFSMLWYCWSSPRRPLFDDKKAVTFDASIWFTWSTATSDTFKVWPFLMQMDKRFKSHSSWLRWQKQSHTGLDAIRSVLLMLLILFRCK